MRRRRNGCSAGVQNTRWTTGCARRSIGIAPTSARQCRRTDMRGERSQSPEAQRIRAEILARVRDYFDAAYEDRPFEPGEDAVPVSGRTFDDRELVSLVDSALDFWLTSGRFARQFERDFARWFGVRECILVNSGSSANLVAIMTLTAEELGERRLRPGDEVIT